MQLKTILSLAFGVALSLTSAAVWAACGDSVCGYEGSSYVCYVETEGGLLRRCTDDRPCAVTCI
jgi:hypothetical protein